MFRIIKEMRELVRQANAIAAGTGEGPRWSWFLTNRSFIFQVIATLFALLAMFGVFLPIDANDLAETVAFIGYALAQLAAIYERFWGKTRVIWSKDQAVKAIDEADALSEALRKAGAK